MGSSYNLSFTAVSLAFHENEELARLYLESGDWGIVEREVEENNLILRQEKVKSRKRVFHELKKRLTTLTDEELAYYREATGAEVKALAMLSCFKCYRFIRDFSSEVLRRKVLLFDYRILDSDYENYYETKRIAYAKLETLSDSTRRKLRQVMFRIFVEAGMLDDLHRRNIQKPYLSENLLRLIVADDPKLLTAFLYSDAEIETMKERVG